MIFLFLFFFFCPEIWSFLMIIKSLTLLVLIFLDGNENSKMVNKHKSEIIEASTIPNDTSLPQSQKYRCRSNFRLSIQLLSSKLFTRVWKQKKKKKNWQRFISSSFRRFTLKKSEKKRMKRNQTCLQTYKIESKIPE